MSDLPAVMREPTVAAIVPAHNAAQFIERTLLSALGQTYRNIQVVVVDDGSTDATADIVRHLAQSHGNVTLHSIPHSGVAVARNTGMGATDADYVAFLDADDLWERTKIERQVAALAAHSGEPEWVGAYGWVRMIDSHDRLFDDGLQWDLRGDFFDRQLVCNPFVCCSNLMVKRSVALSIGGFNADLARRGIGGCEDLEFHLKLLDKHKIEVVEAFLVGYRLHPEQMSGGSYRMRLSEVAVIESIASTYCGRAAAMKKGLAHAYLKSAKGALRRGDRSSALAWAGRAFKTGPLTSLIELWFAVRHEIALAAFRIARQIRGANSPVVNSVAFSELGPEEPAHVPSARHPARRHTVAVADRLRTTRNRN